MGALRCSAFLATSLDGFIAREDGGLDWLEPFAAADEERGYQAFFEAVDVLVVGRGTYDVVLRFPEWPYGKKRCVVLTHRPGPSRHGEEFASGSPAEVVERLQGSGARHAYVDGGAVVSAFLAAGLLDDLTVNLVPVLLGRGIRLFQGTVPERPLHLVESRSFPSGLVQVRYALTRAATAAAPRW